MAKKRKIGRPRKLKVDATRRRLLAYVRDGVSLRVACACVGITYPTLANEAARDDEFAKQLEEAKAHRIVSLTKIAFNHARDDPRTALHLLACLDPTYAKRDEPQQHVHVHDHIITTDERRAELAGILAALRERAGASTVDGTAQRPAIEQANGKHS